jgi:cysteinyl-tRNA synthetase
MKYLGETFDIHGGGRDLIFPHHENEIAQSEGATGSPFARTWLHHGLITINEQKMSKSLKNYITLKSIEDAYSDGVSLLKLLFLGTHYSGPLDFSESKMKMEQSILKRFQEFFYNAELKRKEGYPVNQDTINAFRQKFIDLMENDFNTPEVMTWMQGLISSAYKESDPTQILSFAEVISEVSGEVFGLTFAQSTRPALGEKAILQYVDQRKQAKRDKNFKLADQIREMLLKEYQVELLDDADGITHWSQKF